jgi:hypothetical protein
MAIKRISRINPDPASLKRYADLQSQGSLAKVAHVNWLIDQINAENALKSILLKVSLSAAELFSLKSVPVTIIEAPSASQAVWIHNLAFKWNWNSVAFNHINASVSIITLGNNQVTCTASGVLTATSDLFGIGSVTPGSNNIVPGVAMVATAASDSTAVGDSTLDLWVNYVLIDV